MISDSSTREPRIGDHLFISYASEDYDLAEWLTTKLVAEGYAVWCDQVKLLGGESYPRDIDNAIKHQTFRLIALLSRNSLAKPNPLKERTLALNIAREQKIDFVIPLNVDGLMSTELDWMTSDLTFISFQESWADGFSRLRKKLQSLNAPAPLATAGATMVSDWYTLQDRPANLEESLNSNLLEFITLPDVVWRVESVPRPRLELWPRSWPSSKREANVIWAFSVPVGFRPETVSSFAVEWRTTPEFHGTRTTDVVVHLLREHLRQYCLAMGLRETDRGDLYFPPEAVAGNRLPYRTPSGGKTSLLSTGLRTFRSSKDERRQARYALAPRFWVVRSGDSFRVELQVRLEVQHPDGRPLDARVAQRRRKRITKTWFNHEWLIRVRAIAYWMGAGAREIDLSCGTGVTLSMCSEPTKFKVLGGIDEDIVFGRASLTREVSDEDQDVELADADIEDEELFT